MTRDLISAEQAFDHISADRRGSGLVASLRLESEAAVVLARHPIDRARDLDLFDALPAVPPATRLRVE